MRGADHRPDPRAESEALPCRHPTCPHWPPGLGRTPPKDLGAVREAARTASSQVSAGQAHRAHRRQLRHPQEPRDTTLAGENPKFQLLFQPTYSPWVNVIERLWKAMHDTVTRNHRCRLMFEQCQSVARFLEVVQPFPGNGHAVALLGSAIWVARTARRPSTARPLPRLDDTWPWGRNTLEWGSRAVTVLWMEPTALRRATEKPGDHSVPSRLEADSTLHWVALDSKSWRPHSARYRRLLHLYPDEVRALASCRRHSVCAGRIAARPTFPSL